MIDALGATFYTSDVTKRTRVSASRKPAPARFHRSAARIQPWPPEELYPSSDGQPMAESDVHRDRLIELLDPLTERYRDQPDVYVTGNLFFYYKQGEPEAKVAPDVMVVWGVPKRERRSYRLWEEGRGPALVIEVTSEGTKYEDLYAKKALYEELGVNEYYLFDPLGEYLGKPLVGYRRVGHRFVEVKPRRRDGHIPSDVLGLDLVVVQGRLRLYDPATGQLLPTYAEQEAARQQAEAARQQAEAARQQAEAARQQAEAARQRAEAARQQAEAERAREAEARRHLEEEVARLRAQLKKKTPPSRRTATRLGQRKS